MTRRSDLLLELSADLLASRLPIRFRATGHSMTPEVRDGEAIVVAPIDLREVRRGDVLLYRGPRGPIAHRVVRGPRRDGSWVLKGDALGSCDAPVDPRQVLGRVVGVERNGRTLSLDGVHVRLRRAVRRLASGLRRRLAGARA